MMSRPVLRVLLGLLLLLGLGGCGGGAPASGGGPAAGTAGPAPGPNASQTGVALAVSVKRTPAREGVRLATADDVQEVLIDFLDPTTRRPIIPTTLVERSAPSVDVVIEVPVGTWILRIQGRTASGEVAGTRFEELITVVEGQTTSVEAELDPATQLTTLQVTPGPNALLAQGTTGQFTATGILSDLTTQNLTDQVQWSSSNPSVANISATGLVLAGGNGTTVITARSGNVTGSSNLTVTPSALSSLQVTPSNVSLAPGLTRQLTATGIFADNTNQNVTEQAVWTSSAPSVATVSNTGLVTAVAPGSASIRATLGNVSATASVTVTPTLTRLELTPANVVVPVGSNQAVRATGVFSDNTTQDLTGSVTWATASSAVASVTNTGLVTGVAPGTTSLTATSGNVSATASVRVDPVTLVRLSVAPDPATIPKGATQAFNATGTFSNNSTRDVTQEVTWTSTNSSVAAISNANGTRGVATGVSAGVVIVEATLDGISAAASVNVTPATLVSLALSPSNPAVGSGDLVSFKAFGTFSDGTSLDLTANVTWTSSNTSVVSISNSPGTQGQAISGVNGTSTITAAVGNVTASTSFTTTAPLPPPAPVPSPSPTTQPRLYVANNATPSVTLYTSATTLNGDVAPSLTATTSLLNTRALALDATRNILYVADSEMVQVYSPASTFGGGTPTRTITIGKGVMAVAVDSTRNMLYVATSSEVTTYLNASTLSGAPTVRGTIDSFFTITGLAVDPVNDRLFVGPGNRVIIYDTISTFTGTAANDGYPLGSRTLNSAIANARGLFMDSAGQRLWVADDTIQVYGTLGPTGFDSDQPPVQNLSGSAGSFGTGTVSQAFVDLTNNVLYVADSAANGIFIFNNASGLTGSPTPNRTLSGGATGLNSPASLVVDLTN